ncbi:D-2-hydroxyacid dehydrogenase [bacterium]|nr:D-2-hydroxyacid dehydrogenase [bacterium]
MNIVVLDGYTLNPGDLSWDDLKALASCDIYDRTSSEQLHSRAKYADILITNKCPLRKEHFVELPKLKYVGVTATGYNIVDIEAAKERKIVVTNVPTYGTRSVAQMTFALLLELTQHVGHHSRRVSEGAWTESNDWCFWDRPLIELEDRMMGIVGFGRIGRAVADLALAFGMHAQVATRSRPDDIPNGVRIVELDQLFRTSDVVSLNCPLTPETDQLVNADRLELMKPSAFLLNTSRGPMIDEKALADALNSERIAGAAVDVLSIEPPPANNPLLGAKNCLITPHIAWATRSARARLMNIAVENVRAFLAGRPVNVVK